VITPFGLRHIVLVRSLPSDSTVTDLHGLLAEGRGASREEPATPLGAALRGYFLGARSGVFTYVLRAGDHQTSLRGYAQARAYGASPTWNIARMAPALNSSAEGPPEAPVSRQDAATVWYRLLLHLCIAAGEKGVQRLLARLPADSPAEDVFRQTGFAVYTHEQVFVRSASDAVGSLNSNLRPLLREDAWDAQRLYYRLTPRLVLQVEESDEPGSHVEPLVMLLPNAEQGYALYDRSGEMSACISIAIAPRGSWLRMIVHPDAQASTAEILSHALAVVSQRGAWPLHIAVREYQGGMRGVLEERDFVPLENYALLVKHTTVRVKEPVRNLVHVLEARAKIAPTVSRSGCSRP
jgi:hypothetical protein